MRKKEDTKRKRAISMSRADSWLNLSLWDSLQGGWMQLSSEEVVNLQGMLMLVENEANVDGSSLSWGTSFLWCWSCCACQLQLNVLSEGDVSRLALLNFDEAGRMLCCSCRWRCWGCWGSRPSFSSHCCREAPVRFGSVTVWEGNGSSGSGFRFWRFLCKKGFSVFQYSLTGKNGSGFGSWKTVLAVPVPLSVSGKTVPTVPFCGSGSVPEPPCCCWFGCQSYCWYWLIHSVADHLSLDLMMRHEPGWKGTSQSKRLSTFWWWWWLFREHFAKIRDRLGTGKEQDKEILVNSGSVHPYGRYGNADN